MMIRKADKTDIQALQTLDESLRMHRAAHFDPATTKFHDRVNAYVLFNENDIEEGLTFIAVEEEQAFGFIRGSIAERKNNRLSHLGYIEELFVKEEARGQGVAKSLLSELARAFKERGCDHMTTHTDFENTLSRAFYEKVGMIPATVEYWKEL